MGIEYALRVEQPDPERIPAILRGLPEAVETDQGVNVGPFGGGWPTATVMPDATGVYLCNHGCGTAVLGMLVARLAGEFGPVTVEEL
jgi:hypothetical protein